SGRRPGIPPGQSAIPLISRPPRRKFHAAVFHKRDRRQVMTPDLAAVIADVIAPAAAGTDRSGTFPRAGIEALGKAGVLGLTRGAGRGLRAAAEVVTALAGV